MTIQTKQIRFLVGAVAGFLALLFGAGVHAQTILHVDGDNGFAEPNPPDPADTWDNAFKYLQDALAFIIQNPGPYEVWVAATDSDNPYRPDQCATCGPGGTPGGSGLRTATFNLINNVELYGGFPPLGGVFVARDPEFYETILSGEIAGDIKPPVCEDAQGDCYEEHPTPGCDDPACCTAVCAEPGLGICCQFEWDQTCADAAALICPTASFNAYHVVTADGVDTTARIDGFTITKGFANGFGANESAGGGMLIVVGDGPLYLGDPVVVRCKFIDNVAEWGGGMRILGTDTDQAIAPIVINCTFLDNSAFGSGPSAGGGGMYSEKADTSLTNCKFVGNWANEEGGAIFLRKGAGNDVMIVNCTIADN